MTSQNNTLRCAASTMYSMAGANIPNGAVDALIMDRCFSSGSMISLLPLRQPTRESDRLGAHEWCACPPKPVITVATGLF
jgi:hypothetical protein